MKKQVGDRDGTDENSLNMPCILHNTRLIKVAKRRRLLEDVAKRRAERINPLEDADKSKTLTVQVMDQMKLIVFAVTRSTPLLRHHCSRQGEQDVLSPLENSSW